MGAPLLSILIPPCCKHSANCSPDSRPWMTAAKGRSRRSSRGWHDVPLRWKGACVIAIPLLCLLAQSFWLERLHREEEDAAQWTAHTREVELEAEGLQAALVDGETADRGYLITHDPAFLKPFQNAEQVIPEAIRNLQFLVRDNPAQTSRMNGIAELSAEQMEIIHGIYGADGSGQVHP